MVTKKHRRRQLAQASALRRAERLQARAVRRRRARFAVTTLAVIVAVSLLVFWIVTHETDREATATRGAASAPGVPTPIEVTR